jgi:tetrahydromethanopterin S-methyltransferase subunit F
MMASELDELLVKVSLKVDDTEYQEIKKKVTQLKSDGMKSREQITGSSTQSSMATDSGQSPVLKTLNRSEGYLKQIYTVLRQDYMNKYGKKATDKDLGDNAESVAKTMAVGGGTMTGGAIGAAVGLAVSGLVAGIVALMESLQNKMADKFERELDLHKLSQATGRSVDQIYKLSNQAQLAGTSLQEVVAAGKSLQQELLFGMSDQKAMMFMALGINPMETQRKAKYDPMATAYDLNAQLNKATQGLPAGLASTVKSGLGISENLQYGLNHIGSANVVNMADQVSGVRGGMQSGDEWRSAFVEFKGATQKMQAAIDKALSTSLATQGVIKYMDVKAQAVTLVANSVSGLSDLVTGKISLSDTVADTAGGALNTLGKIGNSVINAVTPTPMSQYKNNQNASRAKVGG